MSETTHHWLEAYGDSYKADRAADLSWVACSASAELYNLIADGTIAPGSVFVDVGCGLGMEAILAASQRMRAYGVDISPLALAKARDLQEVFGLDVTWLEADATAIPLPDGHADVVNDRFFFHNVERDMREAYARSVFRILRPGGLFILRGFSSHMEAGSGPLRLTSDDLLSTFGAGFECEHLAVFQNLPTEKRPRQRHWYSLWRRRPTYGDTRLTSH